MAEIVRPEPSDREVLIRIHASTVTVEEPKARSGRWGYSPPAEVLARLAMGVRRPRNPVLGMELAGEVVATGAGVRRFDVGDRVFGYTGIRLGAHAEYRCLREDGVLATAPHSIPLADAAALPNAALTALTFLNAARVGAGDRVLVNGASGSVGSAAVQIARHLGATVTGVAGTSNLELVRSLGADEVVDHSRQDITDGGSIYDVVFDVASASSFEACAAILAPDGRYLRTDFGLRELVQTRWQRGRRGQRIIALASNFAWRASGLDLIRELVDAGQLRPVIDRRFALEDVVDAHRYVEAGKRGTVVLTIAS